MFGGGHDCCAGGKVELAGAEDACAIADLQMTSCERLVVVGGAGVKAVCHKSTVQQCGGKLDMGPIP